MGQVRIAVPPALAEELDESFFQGPILNEAGMRRMDEEVVARINKLSVVIKADEHPPPHFHIVYGSDDASFSIADGSRLPTIRGLEKYDRNIEKWWKRHYCTLIEVWNRTRPSDCSVGPIEVPPECLTKETAAVDPSDEI